MYKGNSDQLFKLYSDDRRECILKVNNNFIEAIPWFSFSLPIEQITIWSGYNDLPEVISTSTLCLFADDSLLYRQVRNQTDSSDLQKDLSALEEWESK